MIGLRPFLLFAAFCFTRTLADCACGYRDPKTGYLWTDRTITYFNETQSAQQDILFDPSVSPGWSGDGVQGNSGEGQEAWVVGSADVNLWEDGWTSTYRTGYAANNTQLMNTTSFRGLDLSIPKADLAHHTTNGSVLISRRRDILYGSFRASMQVPESWMGGSILEMSARFNESEHITIGLYAADKNASLDNLRWSYSASGHPDAPVIANLTDLGSQNALSFIEHRMDWARWPGLTFGNNANAGNYSQSETFTGGRNKHIPSTPATFSFRHYANGERSQSQGPPIYGTSHGKILYARLFFNSSVTDHISQFESECASSAEAVCSTEDYLLRGSTPFDIAQSTKAYRYVEPPFKAKTWAIIIFSTLLGGSVILLVHAIGRRVIVRRARFKQYNEEHSTSNSLQASPLGSVHSFFENHTQSGSIGVVEEKKTDAAWVSLQVLLKEQVWLEKEEDDDESEDENDWYEDEDDKFSDGIENSYSQKQNESLPTFAERPKLVSSVTNQTLLSLASGSEGEESSTSGRMIIPNTPVRRWRPKKIVTDEAGNQATEATPCDSHDFLQKDPKQIRHTVQSFAKRLHDYIFVSDEEMGKTADGTNKVAYLSSLRGFAAIMVTFGHFVTIFDHIPLNVAIIKQGNYHGHYPDKIYLYYKLIMSVLIGGAASFRVAMFFVLPARILGTRYLAKGGLQNLADKSIRLLVRLIFAVACCSLFEYFLFDVQTFRWIQRIPSRTWTVWSYAESYKNIGEFFNSMVSLWYTAPPVQPAIVARYAIGIMWTMPLIVQLNFTLFLCAIIAREIKNHYKRYAFYSACLFFNWYASKLDTLFIMGLVVADLDVKLDYRAKLGKGIAIVPSMISSRVRFVPRIPGQIVGWIVFCTGFGLFWSEVTGIGPAKHLAVSEVKLKPNFATGNPVGWSDPTSTLNYYDLKLTCILPVLGFYLLCDLSKQFEKIFRLRLFRTLGKHSFGIFALHGACFWSIGSFTMVKLLVAGVPYWAAELITFIVSYICIIAVAVTFTHTVDKWSASLSVAAWRLLTRGYGRRER